MNIKFEIFLFSLHFRFLQNMNIFFPELYIILSSVNIYYVYSYNVSIETSLFIHEDPCEIATGFKTEYGNLPL